MGDIMIDLDYFADEGACLSSTLSDIEIINEGPIITSIIAWLRSAYRKLKEFLSKMWNKLVSLIRSKKKVNDPATTRACQDTLNDPSSYSTDTEATSSSDRWTDASGKTTQVGSFKTNHNIKRRNKLSMNKKFKAVFKGFGHDLYRTPKDALNLAMYETASSKVNRPILDFTSKIMDTVRKVKNAKRVSEVEELEKYAEELCDNFKNQKDYDGKSTTIEFSMEWVKDNFQKVDNALTDIYRTLAKEIFVNSKISLGAQNASKLIEDEFKLDTKMSSDRKDEINRYYKNRPDPDMSWRDAERAVFSYETDVDRAIIKAKSHILTGAYLAIIDMIRNCVKSLCSHILVTQNISTEIYNYVKACADYRKYKLVKEFTDLDDYYAQDLLLEYTDGLDCNIDDEYIENIDRRIYNESQYITSILLSEVIPEV